MAILDKAAIVVSLGWSNITEGVIARIDERLGDGSQGVTPLFKHRRNPRPSPTCLAPAFR